MIKLKKTHEDFELQARALCIHYGLDPDALAIYPDPNGYAVCRRRAQWINYAHELYHHWVLTKLVEHADGN